MSQIRRAFGTLSPVIFFVAADADVEGYHNIMLAPYSDYPTPPRHSREEAGTLAEVDKLQRRLQQQELRKLERDQQRDDRMTEAGRQRVRDTLYARLTSSDTPPAEKDFIRDYLKVREENREKYHARFTEYSCYLYARENNVGQNRRDDEERAPTSIDMRQG